MNNAIFLNNRIQYHLLRQAIRHELELYRQRGFSETSTEIRNLKATLPQVNELHAMPVVEEEKEATNG
jgi:hypothetical protein